MELRDLDREVIAELADMDGCTSRAIATGIGADLRAVQRSLGRLENHALVTSDDYQQRAAKWFLTERGAQEARDGEAGEGA